MDTLPPKVCNKCKTAKSLIDFHKQADKKDGLASQCKVCSNERGRKQYAANPEKHNKRVKDYRTANSEKRRAYEKKYRAENAEKIKASRTRWRLANTERERAARKRWRLKNLEHYRAFARTWRARNPEKWERYRKTYSERYPDANRVAALKWRHANLKKAREGHTRWRKANPDKVSVAWRKRRAKKYSAIGSHTAADVRAQFAAQNGKCWWCGAKLFKTGKYKFHIDHVVALVNGGSDNPENIVCSCPKCNLRKGVKSPLEFAGRLF